MVQGRPRKPFPFFNAEAGLSTPCLLPVCDPKADYDELCNLDAAAVLASVRHILQLATEADDRAAVALRMLLLGPTLSESVLTPALPSSPRQTPGRQWR